MTSTIIDGCERIRAWQPRRREGLARRELAALVAVEWRRAQLLIAAVCLGVVGAVVVGWAVTP
jgi:lambda repressor-like predicted transcriptional regulator